MCRILPEHSTENWNVICSLKSLCTQQIVGLDVFSTSVMWVSLVDSVQQSLIRVCPFLYHFWSEMNLCACFSYYQSLMKLLLLCWGSLGQLPRSRQMRGAGLSYQGVFGKSHCPQLLGLGSCCTQLGLSWICGIHPQKKHLGIPWWCSAWGDPVPCCTLLCGAGWEVCVLEEGKLPSHREGKEKSSCLPRQEADNVKNIKNWDGAVILHFPQLVFAFCVMQNDCNWEYFWDKLPLWLSNMSALLFYVYMSGL